MTADSNGYVGFDLALFIAEKLRAQFVFDMAQMEGNTTTQKMATNFAGLTQARLSNGGDLKVTIAQELQYAKFYIELQQMRFGEKISYHVTVSDDSLLYCLIPKLTIEMLVENAVGHGIEPKEGNGSGFPGGIVHLVGTDIRHSMATIVDGHRFRGQPAVALDKSNAVGSSAAQPVCADEVLMIANTVRVLRHLVGEE